MGNKPMMIKTYLLLFSPNWHRDIFRIFAQNCNLPFEKQRHIMIHDHIKIFIDITTYAIKPMASKIKWRTQLIVVNQTPKKWLEALKKEVFFLVFSNNKCIERCNWFAKISFWSLYFKGAINLVSTIL